MIRYSRYGEGQYDLIMENVLPEKLIADGVRVPAVVIMFDDGWASVFNLALPEMKARRMRGTIYVVSDWIGGSYCSVEQLQELDNQGWTVGNHTKGHENLTTLTEAQTITTLNACNTFLSGIGISENNRLQVAYPGGTYNATTLSALNTVGAKTGRTYNTGGDNNYGPEWPYELKTRNPSVEDSVDTVKSLIDSYVSEKKVLFLTYHRFVTTGPSGISELISKFIEILEYIHSINLQTLTFEEYYRLYSGSITVYHK